jgi:hypothetical protein
LKQSPKRLFYQRWRDTDIRITGLKNAVDKRNQFSPSQNKDLLSVALFRTTLYSLGYDGTPGLVFNNSSLELSRLYLHNHVCH